MRSSRSLQRCRSNKVTVARRSLRLEMLESRALLTSVGLDAVPTLTYHFDHVVYTPPTQTPLPSAQGLLGNSASKVLPLGSPSPVGMTPLQLGPTFPRPARFSPLVRLKRS